MAVLLYANGYTEEYRPAKHTFTDEELLKIFDDFPSLRSYRLYEVPNVWCVWGERDPINQKPDEFNNVGTDLLEQQCYSAVLCIHDTEIDPNWRLTDEIILMGYNDFRVEIMKYFDDVAANILKEREQQRQAQGSPQKLMILEQTGVTEDKRIIFKFDLNKQVEEFFIHENLLEFARKVHSHLKFSYRDGETFAIYADKNIVIVTEDEQVKPFIEKIVALFESRENYEACSVIRNTYERWVKWKKEHPKKTQNKGPEKKK